MSVFDNVTYGAIRDEVREQVAEAVTGVIDRHLERIVAEEVARKVKLATMYVRSRIDEDARKAVEGELRRVVFNRLRVTFKESTK